MSPLGAFPARPRAARGAATWWPVAAVVVVAAVAVAALADHGSPPARADEAAAPTARHPAMAVVDRITHSGDAVPDLTGTPLANARAVLAAAGLEPVPVAMVPDDDRVSAQWPRAGSPQPDDGEVVVWLGAPAPPVMPEPERAPTPQPVPSPRTAAEPSREATEATEATEPGPDDRPAGHEPASPRTSPRRMPASQPGDRLAGPASWYGEAFAGRPTACGATFDPTELTLATRELRCGTRVRVSGPGGSVEATVTDWGPAEWTGRRFDLSQATFATLAPLGAGVVEVAVEVIDP